MTFAENLMELRRQRGLSQEALGDIVDVSRQTVSKWELGLTTPELEKLVQLADYFHISIDALVGRELAMPEPEPQRDQAPACSESCWHYEYKSQRTLLGLPLVHVHFRNHGFARAKGIIAIGNQATGLVAIGALAVGLVAYGGLAFGLLALGGLAFGLLLALGGVSIGTIAFGGVAMGLVAYGGVALGYVAVGGCASGAYALGDVASGSRLSVDNLHEMQLSIREGFRQMPVSEARELVHQELMAECPNIPGWVLRLIERILMA